MIRKGHMFAVLAVGLMLAASQPGAYRKIAASARNFEHRFEDLGGAGKSLNPVERVVFSLALANAAPAAEK